MQKWKLLSSKMAFDHRWFKLRQDTVELPNGKVLDDFFVWLEGTVGMVVPITPEGEFIVVKQYKHAAGDIVLEFPAGMIDDAEDTQVGALREFEEETGYRSEQVTLLAEVMNLPTKVVGKIFIYLALDCKPSGEVHFDELENIEIVKVTPDKLKEMIFSGEFHITGSVTAAFLAMKKLNLI